jgi:hypothetical protein
LLSSFLQIIMGDKKGDARKMEIEREMEMKIKGDKEKLLEDGDRYV